ncbi:MAG: nucleotidyltransferase domain-containing protein [Flavobacteriaceae bacterium]|nr:nucleotidyltransferase domain-containing protein [Flavobacteriaceae bacterium]
MQIQKDIRNNRTEFKNLLIHHNVKFLYAFGSSISNGFDTTKSDIDLMVEIDADDPIERGEKLMQLWDKFEVFFKRKVDLLTDHSIRNPILRKSIDRTKILIYEREGQKILV